MGDKIATFIPAAARKVVYTVLAAAVALEAIWDVVPEPIEGKVLASLVALGFGLAFTQTSD